MTYNPIEEIHVHSYSEPYDERGIRIWVEIWRTRSFATWRPNVYRYVTPASLLRIQRAQAKLAEVN